MSAIQWFEQSATQSKVLYKMGAWDAESVREAMSGPNVPQENLQFGPDIIDDMGPLPASPSSNERLNEGPPAYVYDIAAAAEQSIEIYLEMAENEEEEKQKENAKSETPEVDAGQTAPGIWAKAINRLEVMKRMNKDVVENEESVFHQGRAGTLRR